ncbi:hypothetical protein P4O66_000986 [Electrophorus voltai]|uniref:Uncharacterized protein n=1 Tax=Electrophorus voltai TaxID=2609070 RepID=A0AAD8ZCM4_9TELE|nr:hypothetical protein P4O66_000986 [Electrophorus voltai]
MVILLKLPFCLWFGIMASAKPDEKKEEVPTVSGKLDGERGEKKTGKERRKGEEHEEKGASRKSAAGGGRSEKATERGGGAEKATKKPGVQSLFLSTEDTGTHQPQRYF